MSRTDLRFQGSGKEGTGVRILGLGELGTRASLKHQAQRNGWRVRTRSEEWVRQAEVKSSVRRRYKGRHNHRTWERLWNVLGPAHE